jgi:hypothetical protein
MKKKTRTFPALLRQPALDLTAKLSSKKSRSLKKSAQRVDEKKLRQNYAHKTTNYCWEFLDYKDCRQQDCNDDDDDDDDRSFASWVAKLQEDVVESWKLAMEEEEEEEEKEWVGW